MKRYLTLSFLFALLLLSGKIISQNQNDKWYFGDHAGLDFSSGSPVALTNGQLYNYEGCSTISDNAGNLLFYTNGIQVWNRNHTVMPNGSGLLGNNSTSQSAIIVPNPGNANQYYVFTLDELAGFYGMCYSIVDMTLQAGNGDVTATKNIMLHPSTCEKVTAIQRCDGNVWVISHEWGTNRFFADLVTSTGINPSVNSNVGTVHIGGSNGTWNSVGYMKASQQGNRLALAIREMHEFDVFDFDVNTGVVSNPIALINPGWNVVYGVEFSPDGTKLYGEEILGYKIYQFDLTQGTAAAILASAVVIGTSNNMYFGALQVGPDNKIYVARDITSSLGFDSIAVINNPNALGLACGFVRNGVYLGTGRCMMGLPNFMVWNPSVSPPLNLTVTGNTTICAGDSTTLIASGASTYIWSGGISSTDSIVTVAPLATTTYYIAGSSACLGDATDSVVVNVTTPVIPQFNYSISQCSGEVAFRNLTPGNVLYQWNFGDGNTSNAINPSHIYPAGVYDVLLITNAGSPCADTIVSSVNVDNSSGTDFWIPNAFTPNGDGKNDNFIVYGSPDCMSGHFYIFDRWGELIWETDSPFVQFWDGKYKNHLVENDVYVWKFVGPDTKLYGHVSVIR